MKDDTVLRSMTGKWINCLACYYWTISTTPRHLNVQLKNPEILPMFVCSMFHRVQYTSTPLYLEWTSFLSKEIWTFSSYFSSPQILNESMLSLTHWMWSLFNLSPSLSNLLPHTTLLLLSRDHYTFVVTQFCNSSGHLCSFLPYSNQSQLWQILFIELF